MIPALIPLILGQVAQKVAPKVIDAVVDSLVQAPNVPVQQDSAQATRDALAPVIQKIVGAGKWPIALGGIGTLASGISALCFALANGETNIDVYLTGLGGVVSGVSILWGLRSAGRAVK